MRKTRYDALFALFTLKSAKLGEIAKYAKMSPSSTRQKLAVFEKENIIKRKNRVYEPNKQNPKTWQIFNIMKFCKNKGINYNIFLSYQMAIVISVGLSKDEIKLSDFKKINLKTVRKYLNYLSRINILFVISKKPLIFKFIKEPILEEVLELFEIKQKKKKQSIYSNNNKYKEIKNLFKKYKKLSRDISVLNLEEEQKLEFTSASTQLEGNTFTLKQTTDLIKEDIIPEHKKMREALEVRNYYTAVNYLLSNIKEPMSIQLILDFHRILIFNIGKEGIRTSNVSIKGNIFYKTTHFSKILPVLNELCNNINKFNSEKHSIQEIVEFASYIHNEFQHIHPFEDGNSRTTRLIWNYILIKNEFPLINIYSNTRKEYLSVTKLARKRDDKKLNTFLLGIIIDNLNKMLRANT